MEKNQSIINLAVIPPSPASRIASGIEIFTLRFGVTETDANCAKLFKATTFHLQTPRRTFVDSNQALTHSSEDKKYMVNQSSCAISDENVNKMGKQIPRSKSKTTAQTFPCPHIIPSAGGKRCAAVATTPSTLRFRCLARSTCLSSSLRLTSARAIVQARSAYRTCPSSSLARSFPPCFSVLIFSPAIRSRFSYSLTRASHLFSACPFFACNSASFCSSSASCLVEF